MQEHIVQRRAVRFEVSQHETSFDARLQQISGLAPWFQDDLPIGPAIFGCRDLLNARNPRQARWIGF
jgi:hypothetical protein